MSKLSNSNSENNAINRGKNEEKKIVLPRGAQRLISESLRTSRAFVCSTIAKYEEGFDLKGEKEMSIIEIAIRQSKAYKAKLTKLAKA